MYKKNLVSGLSRVESLEIDQYRYDNEIIDHRSTFHYAACDVVPRTLFKVSREVSARNRLKSCFNN